MTGATGDQGGPAFESWAILELMGHRRLAGYVREITLAGAGMLRIDVPSYCAGGAGATWCAEHGECHCSPDALFRGQPDGACPLHGESTRHGVEGCEVHATQFYSPAALYCLTPATEAEARRVAANSRPHPYVRYERPPAPALAAAPQADGDDGDDQLEDEQPCEGCGALEGEECSPTCPGLDDREIGGAGA